MSPVSFGDFVLDLDARELRRGCQVVPLAPKAYHLLEILVTNRPKALSKIALQERLWPDTFVVEKNLVNLIAEIRQSLGDDPAQPARGQQFDSACSGEAAAPGSAMANTCWDAIRISLSSSIPRASPGATR
jgi:Transcriptional regulatory protein, C terminal